MGSTGHSSRLVFPFFAPPDSLPAPLPTVAEIVHVAKGAKDAKGSMFPCIFEERYIRRVGDHFLVKYGRVKLNEAENMFFVSQQCGTDVLVPQLYAAFHDNQTGQNFIIMEYIPGQTLESLWDVLGRDGRSRVAQHLRTSFDVLRRLPSPGYYGRLGTQPYDDIFLGDVDSSVEGKRRHLPSAPTTTSTILCSSSNSNSNSSSSSSSPSTGGPFPTEATLNEAFHRRYVSLHPHLAVGRGEFYRDCVFPAVLRGHAPVFTHGDLQAKNILIPEAADAVDRDRGRGRGRGRAVVLLDWECAAWYPSYWEYTNALWTSRRWGDDWVRFVGEVLEVHTVEFMCMENLLGDLLDKPQPGV